MRATCLLVSVMLFVPWAQAQECPRVRGSVRLSAVGDILVHQALFRHAVKHPRRFRVLWDKLTPHLQDADLMVGNLEGPAAPGVARVGKVSKAVPDPGLVYDGFVYTGTDFVFNFHPSILDDLKSTGFDLLTLANNHTMDRGPIGVDRTIEQANRVGIGHIGVRPSQSQESRGKVLNVKGFRIAVISCAEMLNGKPDPHGQALLCSNPEIPGLIANLRQRSDAVVVFPHWGSEYQPQPGSRQKSKAREWIKAGALAVVGNHPHVLQTTEWIKTDDGREGLVIYSLGNFVAGQGAMEKRVSAIAHLDLTTSPSGLVIDQYSYTPIERPSGSASLDYLKPGTTGHRHAVAQLGRPRCR